MVYKKQHCSALLDLSLYILMIIVSYFHKLLVIGFDNSVYSLQIGDVGVPQGSLSGTLLFA